MGAEESNSTELALPNVGRYGPGMDATIQLADKGNLRGLVDDGGMQDRELAASGHDNGNGSGTSGRRRETKNSERAGESV